MIRFGLKQEQALKLTMTPELRQAIQILQYSSADLMSYLREQANENPVIDLQEYDISISGASSRREQTRDEYSKSKSANPVDTLDWIAEPPDTLYEHLKAQLGLVRGLTGTRRKTALYLIGNLDEKGYLETDAREAAGLLGIPVGEVLDTLTLVQSFEPAGIAARSLEECLLLQLRRSGEEDPLAVSMVQLHLTDLSCNRLQKMSDSLGASIAEIQETADRIRRLNPSPGSVFAHNEHRYIIADITVEKSDDGYLVRLSDIGSPQVSVNPYYRQMLRELPNQEEARQFIHDKFNTASWLIKSLEQRRQTLTRVAEAIVEMQRDFFDEGIQGLKPLTQKEIAEKTGLHESTISRAVSNKYMQTPRGLFELKYFFTSALAAADGESASSESVKRLIKQLIDAEDKRKPLADQTIAELLAKEGLEISRRTVAKYREEMRILSSAKRKRF
ncbi:RNA polymerase factor sigma-54 [Paenibacillus sp. URB8-2]|uniref:RNA polymerase factor sigma-54 n=1 Tax=Paenibacillus sp. URB8-2 TaxID=2741301 RepID=UPI0015BD9846|nr:RNA polymerase factor sigma-54 [Paenibacillus sp. URB8-2]BCG58613.1 RNA polymerase sigma-54 factor [Paenibacillus sp. URB8-2]